MGFFVWGLWSLPKSHLVVRVLSWRPFVYFGTMSYTLYLVHLIAMNWFNSLDLKLPLPHQIGVVAGGFAISLLMATAIWHWYEKPIYALRRYLPYR